jgi:hypothetical protein
MIDGISGEKPRSEIPKVAEPAKNAAKSYSPPLKKKTDYKLPITAVIVLLLIASASIFVKTRMMHPGIARKEMDESMPITRTGPPKWERPWERPAADIAFFNSQRLRVETTAPVWIRVIADSDTLFTGIMPPDSGQTFTSDNGFLVSVGKNNRVKVYLNGIKVPAFGASEGPLRNYPVGIKEKNE